MNIKIKLLYKLNLETFFLILVDLFSYKHFLIIIILIKPYQTLNIKGKFKKIMLSSLFIIPLFVYFNKIIIWKNLIITINIIHNK
jgi:hypothetical protein